MRGQVHEDCIQDCCWYKRVAAAGGPTPIRQSAVDAVWAIGYIRWDDDGEIDFRFEALPDDRTNLDVAEELRTEWLKSKYHSTASARRQQQDVLHMGPELGLALDAAIELLGLITPLQVAIWLGVDEHKVYPKWCTMRLIDRMIRDGIGNAAIARASTEWGTAGPVRADRVATRRRRLGAEWKQTNY